MLYLMLFISCQCIDIQASPLYLFVWKENNILNKFANVKIFTSVMYYNLE